VAGLHRIVKDSISEMRKITWPDKDATRNLTIVVIAISLILGLLLGGVDAAFVRLWQAIP
jgi:preprotein translocase subunit SecE